MPSGRTLLRKEIITAEAGGASDVESDDVSEGSDASQVLSGRKALFKRAQQLNTPALSDDDASDTGAISGSDEEDEVSNPSDIENNASDDNAISSDPDNQQHPNPPHNPTTNKQRVLILASRGITHRYRHLMTDLQTLLPHSKSEQKFDSKTNLYMLNEVADLANCNNCIFFETRKHSDLYIWYSRTPNGPSIKTHVENSTLTHSILC